MAPKNLSPAASLDSLWSEMAYTRARLAGDPNAAEFAPTIDPYLSEVEETRSGQRRAELGVITAQAHVDGINDRLDDVVIDLADNLVFLLKDRQAPRFTFYFKQPPHTVARMALSSELAIVRKWPESLATEPEELLTAFAPKLTEVVGLGDAALAAQTSALVARNQFRVRVIRPLVGRLNEARFKLYVQLGARAEEKKLGKHWPDAFFKVQSRRGANEPEPEEEEITETPAKADDVG